MTIAASNNSQLMTAAVYIEDEDHEVIFWPDARPGFATMFWPNYVKTACLKKIYGLRNPLSCEDVRVILIELYFRLLMKTNSVCPSEDPVRDTLALHRHIIFLV